MRPRRAAPALALVAATALAGCTAGPPGASRSPAPPPPRTASPDAYVAPAPADVAALPEAAPTMERIVEGLIPFAGGTVEDTVYRLTADAPVYGGDRADEPVARLAALDFLGGPTTVVVATIDGPWALVLTPARAGLPSASPGHRAPAQSAGWVRRDLLVADHPQTRRVVVDVDAATLTIEDLRGRALSSFPVGVGGEANPTPTGVTYIQARYLDPAQGQSEHRIQLTGAYSATADAPWRGSAHIGLHFSADPAGESHGCVRLTAEGIAAVDALPLGTMIRFTGGAAG